MAPPNGRQFPMEISHSSGFQQLRRDAALERQRKSREAKLVECRLVNGNAELGGQSSVVRVACVGGGMCLVRLCDAAI